MSLQEPLIYTTMGNVPVSSLEYSVEWHQGGDTITFVEIYKFKGDVVKRSVHVCKLNGVAAKAEVPVLG